MNRTKVKIEGTLQRFWQAFYFLPLRLKRLGNHFLEGMLSRKKNQLAPLPVSPTRLWWLELSFILADVLAFPEILETINDWLKWKTRPLTPKEIKIASSVFGDTIDYRRVRVDETSKVACQSMHIIYVGFFTINSWGQFGEATLIHELVHVWQFQKYGSVYIPRALLAQRTILGYNYGGVQTLRSVRRGNGSLFDFNFEQQADIIADGYCLRTGLMPRWVSADRSQLFVFEGYLRDLKK